jgi:ATP-dependent protease Clp ATPase subunit
MVNTRNILFIVSGAFAGLEKVVESRTRKSAIGFAAATTERKEADNPLRQATTQDLIDYGFEPEFIGRLPVRVVCDALTSGDLFEIMKRSAGSLIRQYEREFGAYGVEARFEDTALHVIAERAAQEKTGARGLVTAWERVLRDFKFELPSLGLPALVIDEALVQDPQSAMARCREEAQSFTADPRTADIRQFCAAFAAAHDLEIAFEPDAMRALIALADAELTPVADLCQRLFKDYPFGLQLVVRNTGARVFALGRLAVLEPDHYLSDLVAKSYRTSAENPSARSA